MHIAPGWSASLKSIETYRDVSCVLIKEEERLGIIQILTKRASDIENRHQNS